MNKLFRHAQILTADSHWNYFQDGSLLISKDVITWIGSDSIWDPELHPKIDVEIDLSGFTIIPGLINTHAHGGLSIYRGLCDDGDLFSWAKKISSKTSFVDDEIMEIGNYLAVMEQVRAGTTCTCDCNRYGTGIFARVSDKVGNRSISGTLVNSPELRPIGKPNWPNALYETEKAIEEFSSSDRVRFFLGGHSTYSCTGELLVELKKEADRLSLPFNIHVSETKKEVDICIEKNKVPPIVWLEQLGILDSNFIIDHAVWINEKEIELLRNYGCKVAHCPVSNAKLGSGIAPIERLLQSGVVIGLGTDSTISNNSQDLFSEMKFAILLQRAHNNNGSLLAARDVIKMATIDAAKVLGWEKEIGSLEVGKKADFCVIELPEPKNLSLEQVESDLVFSCGQHLVNQVFCNGELIFDKGHFTKFDQHNFQKRLSNFITRSSAL